MTLRLTKRLAILTTCMAATAGLFCPVSSADRCVLQTRKMNTSGGVSRLVDGGFEGNSNGRLPAWDFWQQGYELIPNAGRDASNAIRCHSDSAEIQHGAMQRIELRQERLRPIVASGWSRAEGVDGSPDSGYSIYLDIAYVDGTYLWAQSADFSTGSHDWEQRRCTIMPGKPIAAVTVYPLFRGHTGTVCFDDFALVELFEDTYFEGAAVSSHASRTSAEELVLNTPEEEVRLSANGLDLSVNTALGIVTRFDVNGARVGQRIPLTFVRDAAADSDFLAPEHWTKALHDHSVTLTGTVDSLGLQLAITLDATDNEISFTGRIEDLEGRDRAITAYIALPVEGKGWIWSDDARRERPANEDVLMNVTATGAGATGQCSRYPLAALSGPLGGIALAVPLETPRHHRFGYNVDADWFFLAVDLGLSPDAVKSPQSADFRVVLYSFDPAWRFRAALDGYYARFPESFVKRVPSEGLWMAFADISTVIGWEDFGFAFHEGLNNVAWDEQHNILSFHYTEPMTTWLPLPPEVPRNQAGAAEYLNTLLEKPELGKQEIASIVQGSALRGADGAYVLGVHNAPWCDGCVFGLNPDPDIPASFVSPKNKGRAELRVIEYVLAEAAAKPSQAVDGVYIDSYPFWANTIDYDRAHFAAADIPLVYDTHSFRVGILTIFATFEFVEEVARRMHAQGKYMMANGVLWDRAFPAHSLDVLGTETNWMPNGKWTPMSDEELFFKRALCRHKPYCFLMNTHYDDFTLELTERYMQRALFYGMYPGFFSENASDHCYFATPAWYELARSLFKHYVPLIQRMAKAGWQPITHARSNDPRVLVERYGEPTDGAVYIAALNDSPEALSATICVDLNAFKWDPQRVLLETLTGPPPNEQSSTSGSFSYTMEMGPESVHLGKITMAKP